MKNRKFVYLALYLALVLGLAAGPVFAQTAAPAVKLGVIDVQRLVVESAAGAPGESTLTPRRHSGSGSCIVQRPGTTFHNLYGVRRCAPGGYEQ